MAFNVYRRVAVDRTPEGRKVDNFFFKMQYSTARKVMAVAAMVAGAATSVFGVLGLKDNVADVAHDPRVTNSASALKETGKGAVKDGVNNAREAVIDTAHGRMGEAGQDALRQGHSVYDRLAEIPGDLGAPAQGPGQEPIYAAAGALAVLAGLYGAGKSMESTGEFAGEAKRQRDMWHGRARDEYELARHTLQTDPASALNVRIVPVEGQKDRYALEVTNTLSYPITSAAIDLHKATLDVPELREPGPFRQYSEALALPGVIRPGKTARVNIPVGIAAHEVMLPTAGAVRIDGPGPTPGSKKEFTVVDFSISGGTIEPPTPNQAPIQSVGMLGGNAKGRSL